MSTERTDIIRTQDPIEAEMEGKDLASWLSSRQEARNLPIEALHKKLTAQFQIIFKENCPDGDSSLVLAPNKDGTDWWWQTLYLKLNEVEFSPLGRKFFEAVGIDPKSDKYLIQMMQLKQQGTYWDNYRIRFFVPSPDRNRNLGFEDISFETWTTEQPSYFEFNRRGSYYNDHILFQLNVTAAKQERLEVGISLVSSVGNALRQGVKIARFESPEWGRDLPPQGL